MNNETKNKIDREKLMESLKNLGPPNLTEEFWKEYHESIRKENEYFIRREKELTPTDEQMHRRFTI